jgi:hypothetical protein
MEVRLYTTPTGGTIVAKETFPSVKITAGKFNIKYGNNGIADKLAGTNWVAVAVAGVEQKPRVQIATVPFALHSGDSQALKSRIAALELQIGYLKTTAEGLALKDYMGFTDQNPEWKSEIWNREGKQGAFFSKYTGFEFSDDRARDHFDLWFSDYCTFVQAF